MDRSLKKKTYINKILFRNIPKPTFPPFRLYSICNGLVATLYCAPVKGNVEAEGVGRLPGNQVKLKWLFKKILQAICRFYGSLGNPKSLPFLNPFATNFDP